MDKIALALPGFGNIQNPPGLDTRFPMGPNTNLGSVMEQFIRLAIYVAGFMMIFWFAWGVYEYILARGNKEALAHARGRIWWSLLGFIILLSAVFINQYLQTILFAGSSFINPIEKVCPPGSAGCP